MKKTEDQTKEAIQAGYRYALALTHHHFEAEDLVQEAWMRTLSRYGKISVRTVLYTTIRRIFFDRCRRSNIATFEALEDSGGDRATLYIAPLTPTLERVDPCVRHYDGTEVHFWRDAHRLYALAVDR